MKKGKLTRGDKIIIVFALLLGLSLAGFYSYRNYMADAGTYVTIVMAATGEEVNYSLAKPRQIEVQGALGALTVEIADEKARIVSSSCPDQVCVEVFGWIQKEGQISLCLPNQVLLEVREREGNKEAN